MNPNNAGKDLWLQKKTDMKSLSNTCRHKMLSCASYTVLKMAPWARLHYKVKCCSSRMMRFMRGGRGTPSPWPPTFPLRLWPCNMQHFETKNVWNHPSLASCEVFSITSHFTCCIFKMIVSWPLRIWIILISVSALFIQFC